MKKLCFLMVLFFVIFVGLVSAEQPVVVTNKIFLSPFYRSSMSQNVVYSYNVSTVVPDGISEIKSAIITLDAWINPTRTASITVNGLACNNPSYIIHTTYADAGRGVFTFDCSNVIRPMQNNVVDIVISGGNIGSSTAWLDLTYMNDPVGVVEVHGTEYVSGQNAKVWLQLLNNTGGDIINGICYVDIYTPNNDFFVSDALMTNSESDGIYYYDLVAPSVSGVYPAIAKCYYEADSVEYFPNGNFSMIVGTAIDTTPLEDIQTLDGNFWRFNENSDGVRRALNFTIDINNASSCMNVSESLLTSIGVFSYARFDSAVNDDLNFEIYNWSSSSWIMLPNKHQEGIGWSSTSNTLATNNVTESGFHNSSIGGFRLRITDSVVTDGADNNFDVDQLYVSCNQLSNPNWQEVKGSSELHINNEYDLSVEVNTLCGDEKPLSSDCMYFESGYIEPEGVLVDNITVTNSLGLAVSDYFNYETPRGVDCTAIFEINRSINGSVVSLLDDVVLASGLEDNCVITIPIDFDYGVTSMDIVVVLDNYVLWDIIRSKDFRDFLEDFKEECLSEGAFYNFTFEVPLTNFSSSYTSNPVLIFCGRVLDDFYWYDYFYNDSLNISVVGDLESYHYELTEFTIPLIIEEYNTYRDFKQVGDVALLLNYTDDVGGDVWSYSNRSLTQSVDAVIVNPEDVWNVSVRNLTFYPEQLDLTNYSRIEASVNASTVNITGVLSAMDSKLDNILSAFSNIASDVWGYFARYTHGEVLT